MSEMHNPAHPGEVLLDSVFSDPDMSVTRFAELLGVGRVTVSKILNKRSGVSPSMALRLSKVLGTSPDMWLRMQANYDLWQARHDSIVASALKKLRPLSKAA